VYEKYSRHVISVGLHRRGETKSSIIHKQKIHLDKILNEKYSVYIYHQTLPTKGESANVILLLESSTWLLSISNVRMFVCDNPTKAGHQKMRRIENTPLLPVLPKQKGSLSRID